jgi:hypothetical protein
MARTITTTTTVTIAGFTFNIHGRGSTIQGSNSTVRIAIQHLDANGNSVQLPRSTAQTVRRPHKPGQSLPPKPEDKNLATVLAKTYSGTPQQVLAAMAADYEALEYPPT